jgi:hypothetical protein
MRSPVLRSLALVVSALLIFAAAGCSKKATKPKPGGTAGPTTSQQLAAADSILGVILSQQSSGQPTRPSDLDFSTPYNTYQSIYQSDPGNHHARFGLAVLGLASLTTNTEVNAAFDEWSSYLASHTPFVRPGAPAPATRPLGIPAGISNSREAFRLPYRLVPLSLLAESRAALIANDPQISRTQAIIRDLVLPKLDQTIVHLDALAAGDTFQFIVTPAMQGDPDASPVEIDVTDLLAMRSACNLLASLCNIAVAYNLGFATYDSAGLYAGIQPGSSWLKLASGGASRMGMAQARLLNSVDDLGEAITSLEAESDPQDDDLIKIGPQGIQQASVDSVVANLATVRSAILSGFTLTEDWDHDAGTAELPLTLRVDKLFTSPVPDWKALLPGYTGSVTSRPHNRFYAQFVGSHTDSLATFTVPSAGIYQGNYYLDVYGGQEHEYVYGDDQIVVGLRAMVHTYYLHVQAISGWSGEFSASAYFYGSLLFATNQKAVGAYASYSLATSSVAVPVITWNANDASQWIWPDPTFNGLLPGFSSSNQMLTTFGFDPAGWSKVNVLDFTQ